MSDTRPSGGDQGGAAELLASARARLSAAAADLAIPPPLRLTEWQRALVSALLSGLVRDIEDELRLRLAESMSDERLRAAFGSAHLPIAQPILEAGGALSDPDLIAALLRRAEEHRLRSSADHALLGELAGDADPVVAAEAMSLLILESSRLDVFGEPVMGRSALPAELQHRLAWSVAAALRRYMVGRHGAAPAAADAALAPAVADLLARYDEGDGVEARSLRLARRLSELGRLGDAFLVRTLPEAGLPLLLASLAVRTGLDLAAAWDLLAEPSGRGGAFLLRAAGIGREAAASLLLQLGTGAAVLPSRLDAFDTLATGEAEGVLLPWRADRTYRAALADLGA